METRITRETLKAHGLSQRDVKRRLNLSDTTISLFLSGKRDLAPKKLATLKEMLAEEVETEA